jgi:Ca-activated chloride channel family protein
MRRAAIVIGLIGVCLMACGSLQAESRVRVFADVDKPLVLGDRADRVVVKVGLEGRRIPVMSTRVPLNVAIVLDKSGSMASDYKMENAKRGAMEIVERLDRDDIISLIVYDNEPRVLIPAQQVKDKDAMLETISAVYAGGSTALYGGVSLGAVQVRRSLSWRYINRIILLSDGLANVGLQSTEDLANLGRSLADEGITVTTIGVGLDYNEDLMTALAARSGGNAYFASSGSELPKIFSEEIGEAMTVAARDIRILLRCPDGLRPVGVVGRSGEVQGQTMSVTIGELYGDKTKFALFEVEVPPGRAGRNLEIADVTVEYSDPRTNEKSEDALTIAVAYDNDEEAVRDHQNKDITKEVALTKVSEAKREAVGLADKGHYEAAAGLLRENALALEKVAAECDNDAEMLRESEMCEDISSDVEANTGFSKYLRKRVVNQAYTQTTQQGYVSDDSTDTGKTKKK